MEEKKSHCHHMTFVNIVGSGGNSSSRDSGRCGEGALKFITAMKTNFLPTNVAADAAVCHDT